MIILGDAGFNYWLDKTDRKLKYNLSKLPMSFLIIHGNHGERTSEIDTYRERKWQNGIVYYGVV